MMGINRVKSVHISTGIMNFDIPVNGLFAYTVMSFNPPQKSPRGWQKTSFIFPHHLAIKTDGYPEYRLQIPSGIKSGKLITRFINRN